MKNNLNNIIFNNYTDFGATEIVADCIGPLIDISKINQFKNIEYVRYLTEDEIVEKLKQENSDITTTTQVRDIVKEALNHSKLAVNLVDIEMVKQLCRAKIFFSVKIISTVDDSELFDEIKNLLIRFTHQIITFDPDMKEGGMPFDDTDFIHINNNNFPGILQYYEDNANQFDEFVYRIAIDDDALAFSTIGNISHKIPNFQEWIGGIREDNNVQRLKEVLEKRQHIYNAIQSIKRMCDNKTIDLNRYTIMKNYYVYASELREQLEQRIDSIKIMLNEGASKNKPICVFLAGTPGTGKTFFVDCFAKEMNANIDYPVTSLSGVSVNNFYDAIEYHVEQVYNTRIDEKKTSIAFLDEIDTKSDYFAFRFLMDAMTGVRTNDKGIRMKEFKSGTVENLVWFFAGSAGATRQEFMNSLRKDERKVMDFFDRIHFDLQLPSVSDPGQAILTLLSAIESFWPKDILPKKISIKVLLAFACTKWSSTRSIMTICRVAAAKYKSHYEQIELDLFDGIDTSEDFHKQYSFIREHVKDNTIVNINWPKGE